MLGIHEASRRASQRSRIAVDRNVFWGHPGVVPTTLHCLKATIAQVHGYCYGASMEVALACDFVIASEDGKVYSLDTSNNQLKQLANVEAAIHAPLCASNGVVYIHSAEQALHALNVQAGVKLWDISLGGK